MTTKLVDGWLHLWNGELERAADLVTPGFRVHAAMMDGGDGSAVSGPDALAGWIAQTRAAFSELTFRVEVGPIVQDELLALRWSVKGTYGGGFPAATAEPGTPIEFTGTDLLRVEDGRFTEYWVNSDIHVLLSQLKV
ncbi:ester cyclase [Streptomyces lushanensis]|uniref:ester cyclase n=1 Tax=Streptomyces lushanensis TaxID=1434255 RepID=UPI000829B8E7|nr:nuclear transport factor 2 family protein [Streptomyces lushanensis]